MSIIVIIVIIVVAIVVVGGLMPALADELRARRRDARALAWTAAQAKGQADQAAWARDRAQDTRDSAWASYMGDTNGWGASSIRWEQARDAARASAQTAWDASQEAGEAKAQAKEAQERATLKAVVMEALRGLKG